MPDAEFAHPRLAAVYDALDGERADLVPYLGITRELGARRVVDLGCGTGVLALLFAAAGCEVVGVDPARASLGAARAKPRAGEVRWIEGDAAALSALEPAVDADLAVMTGNAAQAIVDPADWTATLTAVHGTLRPGGWFVFETRDPAAQAWRAWNPDDSRFVTDVPGEGPVQSWVELLSADLPLVSFRWTFVFVADGAVLTSESTLRFRERDEVEASLVAAGFELTEVRDAPDRPGRELVFLARR